MIALLTRRRALALLAAGGIAFMLPVLPAGEARAATGQQDAIGFVRGLSEKLVTIINGQAPMAQKRQEILPLIDQNVDVNGIARFCLGRYWHQATPEQQQQFMTLFHHVLLNSITGKLGEYTGVRISTGSSTPRPNGTTMVSTQIDRPGQPQTSVQWVVGDVDGQPKIKDVIGEGVSLSITQRGDYSSYLQRNGNNIEALLNAMHRQAARAS